jgi:tripartite-type tricarboxylate transporter receptor subunit TctC
MKVRERVGSLDSAAGTRDVPSPKNTIEERFGRELMRKAAFLATLVGSILAVAPAWADPIADFYRGKRIEFVIRSGVGGGYDLFSRLLARHMPKHIPGNPQVVPINMPGAGGIVAANHVANRAPRDGTVLTIVGQGLVVDQALGLNSSFKADLREFNWIGNVSKANQVLVTWHTSKTQTLKDAMARETPIGATGAGDISAQVPAVLNNIVGTKFKIIQGYPGGKEVNLAMDRGELEGRGTNPWVSYKATEPRLVAEKLITPIVQVGLTKDRDLPDVPLMRDLARNPEQQAVLDFVSEAVVVGRPIATTPGVPAERVAALRQAFDKTLADPEFLKDAETQRADLDPMSGADLEALVHKLIGAPADLKAKVKAAIEPGHVQDVSKDGTKN